MLYCPNCGLRLDKLTIDGKGYVKCYVCGYFQEDDEWPGNV